MTTKTEDHVPLFRNHIVHFERSFIYHINKEVPGKSFDRPIANAYTCLLNCLMHNPETFTINTVFATSLTITITFSDTQQVTVHDGNKEVLAEKERFTITAATSDDMRPLLELLYWHYCIMDWDQHGALMLDELFDKEKPRGRSALPQFVLSSYLKFGGYLERKILERYHFTDSDLRALKQNRGKNTDLDIAAASDLWMNDSDGVEQKFADVLRGHGILPPLEDAA